jgi:hypothetical protein
MLDAIGLNPIMSKQKNMAIILKNFINYPSLKAVPLFDCLIKIRIKPVVKKPALSAHCELMNYRHIKKCRGKYKLPIMLTC